MERIKVDLPGRGYEIVIGSSLVGEIAGAVRGLEGCGKVALVSHPTLERLHRERWDELEARLRERGVELHPVLFRQGERSKNLNTVKRVYERLLSLGMQRSDAVIAWGGGVAGDLAGFAAASYMRGIRYLQVPTTLMAMVDSSIGGKVGVDLPEGKNLVGFFHQPAGVFCDVDLLATLPGRERRSGLAEMAKYALVFDASLYGFMTERKGGLAAGAEADLAPAISECAAIKARVTEEDEYDLRGRRVLLNYGHTFAHALEAATSYRIFLHGEAVALGMRMAAALAEDLGLAERGLRAAHRGLLSGLGLDGVSALAGDTAGLADAMMERMAFDKKGEAGKLRLVLLRKIGEAAVVERQPDRRMAASIRAALAEDAGGGSRKGVKGE